MRVDEGDVERHEHAPHREARLDVGLEREEEPIERAEVIDPGKALCPLARSVSHRDEELDLAHRHPGGREVAQWLGDAGRRSREPVTRGDTRCDEEDLEDCLTTPHQPSVAGRGEPGVASSPRYNPGDARPRRTPGDVKAAVRDVYGPPEVVRVEEVETPTPTGNQVLVRVRAASVNRADLDGLYPRWQFTRLFLGLRKPKSRSLGLDFAGVVEAVGPEATRFKVGDRVFGDLSAYRDGAFAEYVRIRETGCAAIPEGMTFEDAATLPHSAILALQGLRLRKGRTIQPGDRVLVDGASGNVGPFVIQIAKATGAAVTGVARTEKVDFVRSLGVDDVIDYTQVDYTRAGQQYDWIVAVDAHYSFLAVRRALRRGGVYVAMGGSGAWLLKALFWAPVLSKVTGKRLGLLLWWKPFNAPDVATILDLIAAGKVRPAIDREFPLSETAEALRYVDDGRARGKVIIKP